MSRAEEIYQASERVNHWTSQDDKWADCAVMFHVCCQYQKTSFKLDSCACKIQFETFSLSTLMCFPSSPASSSSLPSMSRRQKHVSRVCLTAFKVNTFNPANSRYSKSPWSAGYHQYIERLIVKTQTHKRGESCQGIMTLLGNKTINSDSHRAITPPAAWVNNSVTI